VAQIVFENGVLFDPASGELGVLAPGATASAA